MRLWHKDLIPSLPKNQLLAQWRECCCIAKSIHDKDTPNHILVNKIMDYPIEHFITYSYLIFNEMNNRDYNVYSSKFAKYFNVPFCPYITTNDLFKYWHNDRYLKQCLFNLQEKFDCHGISYTEWMDIQNRFGDYI